MFSESFILMFSSKLIIARPISLEREILEPPPALALIKSLPHVDTYITGSVAN